ncbi:MAG: formate dehydrogenase accessory sulfurtransferase FdhD [Candidatus Pacebacteria bacterium]|nr:formate dehydrogenase accessory sulfurtransferase FdhD [Candidatus Paceibacterota bacterium]
MIKKPTLPPPPIVTVATRRHSVERTESTAIANHAIANEVPIALVYNGISHAVMLATPQDMEDFAVGFSLTEGIIPSLDQLIDFKTVESPQGIEAQLTISQRQMRQLESRRRSLSGATGCGLCGIDSLTAVTREIPPRPANTITVAAAAIFAAMESLGKAQPLNQQSHSIHAAGFATADGQVLRVREDVGRHNALDKLIGALARDQIAAADGMILLTSRCSFELVQKTAMAGVKTLVAISAPTALAIELAEQHGISLVAVARRDSFLLFTHPERIIQT